MRSLPVTTLALQTQRCDGITSAAELMVQQSALARIALGVVFQLYLLISLRLWRPSAASWPRTAFGHPASGFLS